MSESVLFLSCHSLFFVWFLLFFLLSLLPNEEIEREKLSISF